MNREIVGPFFLIGILAAAWATIASTPCKTQPTPQKDYTSALVDFCIANYEGEALTQCALKVVGK